MNCLSPHFKFAYNLQAMHAFLGSCIFYTEKSKYLLKKNYKINLLWITVRQKLVLCHWMSDTYKHEAHIKICCTQWSGIRWGTWSLLRCVSATMWATSSCHQFLLQGLGCMCENGQHFRCRLYLYDRQNIRMNVGVCLYDASSLKLSISLHR